jgi:hypothetical protein
MTAHCGTQFAVSLMVVNDLKDSNPGHTCCVQPTTRERRKRVMVGLEDESKRATEVERKLA